MVAEVVLKALLTVQVVIRSWHTTCLNTSQIALETVKQAASKSRPRELHTRAAASCQMDSKWQHCALGFLL